MNPRLLQRKREELNPTNSLLNEYALTPPSYRDTEPEEDEFPDVNLLPNDDDSDELPRVAPSPDHSEMEDPVTKYGDYGVEDYKQLSSMEPEPLRRRGPWHQILGGLADMSPITRGLVPNLVYHNYDEARNQKQAFEQQEAKADLEATNRRTSMIAGTSAYSTDVRKTQDEWNRGPGLEYKIRQAGWAPKNEVPSTSIVPNVPPQNINGVEYVQLKDPNNVSFSYVIQNPETGTNNLLVLYKDGTTSIDDTDIKYIQRSQSTTTNSLLMDIANLKQLVESGELSQEQLQQVQKDLSAKEAALESIKEYDTTKVETEASIRTKHSPTPRDTDPQDSAGLREAIERHRRTDPEATDEEIRERALLERAPKDPNERPQGFPTGADATVDTARVAANVTNIGEFKPGMWNFLPFVGGTSEEEALNNVKSANQLIIDLADKSSQTRGKDMSGFLPSIHANTTGLPKELQKRFKQYIQSYNENLPLLQETGDDLWYHPTEGFVITPRSLVEDTENDINTMEEAVAALQSQKFQQYRFVTK